MGRWANFLEKWFPTTEKYGGTVTIEVSADIYYKNLAIYKALSLVSNAISKCEIRTFVGGKEEKKEDYFLLNVAPNRNENASFFWHKVVKKMMTDEEALVVEYGKKLFCAESFSENKKDSIGGNIYENIVLDDGQTMLTRKYKAEEVYLFRMEDDNITKLISGVYEDYGKLLKSAIRAFKDTNGKKFKFKVSAVKAGDEEFAKEFEEIISKQIKNYMENDYATYVEYEGETLEEQKVNGRVNSDDLIKIRKDMFEMVAQAFKIPQSLMEGNVTSVKDVMDVFLTFAVDPYADAIEEVLNKRAGYEEFSKGNFYKVDSRKIRHKDLFDLSISAEKLITSAIMNQDEIRCELGLPELNTEWSQKYYMTKNISKVEDIANEIAEKGGEKG